MTDKLTGRSRVRAFKSWGNVLLVLQVEIEGKRLRSIRNPELELQTWWRDASVEDLIVEDGKCS